MPKPKSKNEIDVKKAFDEYVKVGLALEPLKQRVAELEKEREIFKRLLLDNVKPGEVRDGVFHKQIVSKSVSYKSALESIRDRLVPKTKHLEAETIIAEFTKTTYRDDFEEA